MGKGKVEAAAAAAARVEKDAAARRARKTSRTFRDDHPSREEFEAALW
jgi:hypothetical protein